MTDNAANATYTPQRDRIFNDLSKLVSFNSVHSTPELADQHEDACAWTVNALEDLGLDVTRYPTVDDADTIVAKREPKNGAPTVLLYSHYDVVPALSLIHISEPTRPY